MQSESPTPQHQWLARFAGDWTYEASCASGPGQPESKTTGSERVRMMGQLWIVGDGTGQAPDGSTMAYHFVIGFDPAKQKFVGNWTGSCMTHMFIYEGELDQSGTTLPLECTGPNPMQPGTTATYRDILEMHPDGRRAMRSQAKGPDGNWVQFMQCVFRRA